MMNVKRAGCEAELSQLVSCQSLPNLDLLDINGDTSLLTIITAPHTTATTSNSLGFLTTQKQVEDKDERSVIIEYSGPQHKLVANVLVKLQLEA